MLTASIVIVAWNGEEFLVSCLAAAASQRLPPDDYEVIVVDNGSADDSAALVRSRFPGVRLIEAGRNLGYAGGANLGWQAGEGRVLALLNQDTIPRPGWLAALVAALEDPAVGIVGSKLLEPDGVTLQHAGAYYDWPLVEGLHYGRGEVDRGQYDEPRNVEFVTGAALAARRAVLAQLGWMDEGFFPGYFEDVDLCLRAWQAGYQVRYVPQAVALHCESSSFDRTPADKWLVAYQSRLRFILKHYTPVQIVDEFVPAETARLPSLSVKQLRGLALACTRAQIWWPTLARALPTPPSRDATLQVVAALQTLHEAVSRRQVQALRR